MVDTVKTIKSSGGDYSSLSAWEAGQQKVISAGNTEQAECYNFQDTTGIIIDGWTTVATGYIRIYTPSTERHTGTRGTGYRLVVSGAGVDAINNAEEYVRLEGLELKASGSGASGFDHSGSISATVSDQRIESCLVYECAAAGVWMGDGIVKVSNCIIVGNTGDGITCDFGNTGGTFYLYNNTLCANTAYGINRTNSTVNAKNNYCGGNTTADYTGAFNTKTKCASSDTSGTASYQSIAYSTSAGAYFTSVTAGSQNLHIGLSSALKDVADDLSGDASYPITVDIDGTTRSGSWDIGADEYVSAAVGGPGASFIRLNNGTRKFGGITA